MPEHDISDITLEAILGDLRAEGIDLETGTEVTHRSDVTGEIRHPILSPDAALTRRLDVLTSRALRTLHDRRRPWTFLSINHLVVCPAGVVIVDALDARSRPSLRLEGGTGGLRERLVVGDRDCTKRVESLLDGVRAVTRALTRSLPEPRGIDVHGVLAWMADDQPAPSGAFTVRGIHVIGPDRLSARVAGPGPLRFDEIEIVTAALAKAFPAA